MLRSSLKLARVRPGRAGKKVARVQIAGEEKQGSRSPARVEIATAVNVSWVAER